MAIKVRNPVLDVFCIGIIVVVFLIIVIAVIDYILQEREEMWFIEEETWFIDVEPQDNFVSTSHCDYCGCMLNAHDRQCPCCGAVNKHYQCAEKYEKGGSDGKYNNDRITNI